MEEVTVVFDVDDTICSNIKRLGYDKCVPDEEVIRKINHMHDELGFRIVLHTARGMVSCNGDEAKIIAKNKVVLEEWLKKHNVHYDELIFCKPIADLYVDDRAMSVKDFKKQEFGMLKGGGSKKSVVRLGSIVKKEFGSEKETLEYKDWVEDNNGSSKFPAVISYLYDAVYMDYVDGRSLYETLDDESFSEVLNTIGRFSKMKADTFSIVPQVKVLIRNLSGDEEFDRMINVCADALFRNEEEFAKRASYCHGDMILSNVIRENGSGELYFIDPRYVRGSSTYLFDLAKLRNSLWGYEYAFGLSDKKIRGSFLNELDFILKLLRVYDLVMVLHFMYILRLYRYKDGAGKLKVKMLAKGFLKEHERAILGSQKRE